MPHTGSERTAPRIAARAAWASLVLVGPATALVLRGRLGTSSDTGRPTTVARTVLAQDLRGPAILYVIGATALPAVGVALGWSPLVSRARWTRAGLLFVLCVLGGFSIGLLSLPSAAALALAGLFGLGSQPARRGAA